MSSNPYAWLDKSLAAIQAAKWYRRPTEAHGIPGRLIEIQDRHLLNFGSNNYLGLAGDQSLIDAAVTALHAHGTGSTGSRLLSGHLKLHRELEQKLASLKQTEDALVFSSGYLANLGVISALVGQRDIIIADEYNHSSLKQGARVSQAQVLEYTHNSVEELRKLLAHERHRYRRCLITTDSIFSMDGDLCQLPQLVELARAFNSMLLIDEAHATGVIGPKGAGCVAHFNCTGYPLIQIGTLSKALGSLGGYVAGSAPLIDFLRNRTSTWIYTTGLSPADTAAALAALEIITTDDSRKTRLWQNVTYLQGLLQQSHLVTLPSQSPIICIPYDTPQRALEASNWLRQFGIYAPAIRPPTVPTSRVRLTVMASHQTTDLDYLVKVLQQFVNKQQCHTN